jgi:5-methylcytosine-specific restriction endonuclease McrA
VPSTRDRFVCQNCGVHTEFIHYDHKFPFDLGVKTTDFHLSDHTKWELIAQGRSPRRHT